MEIVGLRKPARPPQPDPEAEVAKKPTAPKPPEGEKKLKGPPARPTGPIQKPTRPKQRPQVKPQKNKFELNIVSSGTNSEGEEFRPGDLVKLEVMGFVTNARIASFYQAKENGEVWASYAPAGEEKWLGGCMLASELTRATA